MPSVPFEPRRVCWICEQPVAPTRNVRLLGLPLGYVYRCPTCKTRFELTTPLGTFVLLATFTGIALATVLLPDTKFRSENERFWLQLIGLVQVGIAAGFLHRAREHARAFPPAGTTAPTWEPAPVPDPVLFGSPGDERKARPTMLYVGAGLMALVLTTCGVRNELQDRRVSALYEHHRALHQQAREHMVALGRRLPEVPPTLQAERCPAGRPGASTHVPLVRAEVLRWLGAGADPRQSPRSVPGWMNSAAFSNLAYLSTPSREEPSLQRAIAALEALLRADTVAVLWTSAPSATGEAAGPGGPTRESDLVLFDVGTAAPRCRVSLSSGPGLALWLKQDSEEATTWAIGHARDQAASRAFWTGAREALARAQAEVVLAEP